MRRFLLALVLFVPGLLLIFFFVQPQADPTFRLPLFHFYIVTFTSFAASVVSVLLSTVLEAVARPRHVLVAVAFAVMGTLFLTHGLTTPGALIPATHPAVPAVGWSAWLTLFAGGVVFVLAASARPGKETRYRAGHVGAAAAAFTLGYIAVILFSPGWLATLQSSAAPWHRRILFYVTLLLWLLAAFRFWQTWRATGNRVDGALALTAWWMAVGSVSMHQFPVWQLSWWLYHFLLLTGFLTTVIVLIGAYEQTRRFRLLRYYLATSLIMTALLALVGSYLFAGFAQRILFAQAERTSAELVETLIADVAMMVPEGTSPAGALVRYGQQLPVLPMSELAVYAANGEEVVPARAGALEPEPEAFAAALAGETVVEVYGPDSPPAGYTPESGAHTIVSTAALPAAGGNTLGVLVTVRDAPQLTQDILDARATGLAISGLAMGLLFLILLFVVFRADRIITARTRELAIAYQDLRQAEGMRDDLTGMVVHDLRTPLTAITASADLFKRAGGKLDAAQQERLVSRIRAAAGRLNAMIDDILTVSRIEAGELILHKDNVMLAELLADRVEVFAAQATAQNKHLTLDCDASLEAELDPELTGRVVENLIGNALKYTGTDGHVRVAAFRKNGRVHLGVRDDGEGVPDEYKEAIFGKFAQVEPSEDRPGRKGTGLGLAFCRLVVEVHGGEIWVEDAPGGGSHFKLWIPDDATTS